MGTPCIYRAAIIAENITIKIIPGEVSLARNLPLEENFSFFFSLLLLLLFLIIKLSSPLTTYDRTIHASRQVTTKRFSLSMSKFLEEHKIRELPYFIDSNRVACVNLFQRLKRAIFARLVTE